MSNGGVLLPSVGKQAQLISEPSSPNSIKNSSKSKSKSKRGDDGGNMFLLTKEEELAKVHNTAILATLDKVSISIY